MAQLTEQLRDARPDDPPPPTSPAPDDPEQAVARCSLHDNPLHWDYDEQVWRCSRGKGRGHPVPSERTGATVTWGPKRQAYGGGRRPIEGRKLLLKLADTEPGVRAEADRHVAETGAAYNLTETVRQLLREALDARQTAREITEDTGAA